MKMLRGVALRGHLAGSLILGLLASTAACGDDTTGAGGGGTGGGSPASTTSSTSGTSASSASTSSSAGTGGEAAGGGGGGAPVLPAPDELEPGVWNELVPGGDTICARGTPYSFWVRPGTS